MVWTHSWPEMHRSLDMHNARALPLLLPYGFPAPTQLQIAAGGISYKMRTRI